MGCEKINLRTGYSFFVNRYTIILYYVAALYRLNNYKNKPFRTHRTHIMLYYINTLGHSDLDEEVYITRLF